MGAILRNSLRSLRLRAARFALTGVAVMLGVAFMSGARVFTDTIVNALNTVISQSTTGVDLVVVGQSAINSSRPFDLPPVSQQVVDQINTVKPDVRAAVGSFRGPVALSDDKGKPLGQGAARFAFGTNWIDNDAIGAPLNPYRVFEGRAPANPGEIVLNQSSAKRFGVKVGDTVGVTGLTLTRPAKIVGIIELSSGVSPAGTVVAADSATAKDLFGRADGFDQVLVSTRPGADLPRVTAEIQAKIAPTAVRIVSAGEEAARQRERLKENIVPFERLLTGFVFISLFVGSFIVANTFGVLLARRTRELALMRTLGAGRTQLTIGLLFEAAVLGIAAGVVGLGVGIGVARGLRSLLANTGVPLPTGPLIITRATVVSAFFIGLLVTVLAALVPVIRAGRTRPIAALRDSELEPTRISRVRTVAGIITIALGVYLFLVNRPQGVDGLTGLGLGAAITIIGVVVVGPAIMRPTLRVLGTPARLLSGSAGQLARDNARRNPRRTNATVAAVMIGAALVVFVTILASSVQASVDAIVNRAFRADYVVDAGFRRGGFEPTVAEQLRATKDANGQLVFGAVSPLRFVDGQTPSGTRIDVIGVDTASVDQLLDLGPQQPINNVKKDDVAIYKGEADAKGIRVGDTVRLVFARGERALTVKSILNEQFGDRNSNYLVDLTTLADTTFENYDATLLVDLAPGVKPAAGRAAIEKALTPYPQAEVSDRAQLKNQIASRISIVLNLFYALLGLSVVIAIIGVANTLALSVHERTRELGLLRAVGMTRRQVRTSVRWEAVMVALLGTLIGLVLAIAGSWGFVTALRDQGVIRLDIPPIPVLIICAIAIVAAVLAALGPARRAARIDVLAAIAAE